MMSVLRAVLNFSFYSFVSPFRFKDDRISYFPYFYILRKICGGFLVTTATLSSYNVIRLSDAQISPFTFLVGITLRFIWIAFEICEGFVTITRRQKISLFLEKVVKSSETHPFPGKMSYLSLRLLRIIQCLITFSIIFLSSFVPYLFRTYYAAEAFLVNDAMYLIGTWWFFLYCVLFITVLNLFQIQLQSLKFDTVIHRTVISYFSNLRSVFEHFLGIFGETLICALFLFLFLLTTNIYLLLLYFQNSNILSGHGLSLLYFYHMTSLLSVACLVVCWQHELVLNKVSVLVN